MDETDKFYDVHFYVCILHGFKFLILPLDYFVHVVSEFSKFVFTFSSDSDISFFKENAETMYTKIIPGLPATLTDYTNIKYNGFICI